MRTSTEAVENGFADEFGFVDDAVADAAAEAGLDSYTVDTRRTEDQIPGGISPSNVTMGRLLSLTELMTHSEMVSCLQSLQKRGMRQSTMISL